MVRTRAVLPTMPGLTTRIATSILPANTRADLLQVSTQTDQIVLNSRATLLYDTTDWTEKHTGFTSRKTRQPISQSSNQRNEQTTELEAILSSEHAGPTIDRDIPYQPLPFFQQLHAQSTHWDPYFTLGG